MLLATLLRPEEDDPRPLIVLITKVKICDRRIEYLYQSEAAKDF